MKYIIVAIIMFVIGLGAGFILDKDRPYCEVPMSVEYCASLNWDKEASSNAEYGGGGGSAVGGVLSDPPRNTLDAEPIVPPVK